jgi:hypothetical protein
MGSGAGADVRKILLFNDIECPGEGAELSPLTLEEFTKLDKWAGTNDLAYREFLKHNRFHELESFTSETMNAASLVIWDDSPIIDWAVRYGDIDSHDPHTCEVCRTWPGWKLREQEPA